MDKIDIRFPYAPGGAGPAAGAASGPPAAKPAPGLPKNALERATALIGLMDRLAVLMKRESDAVRRRRPVAEIRALVKEKEPMVLVYEEISRLLRVDAEGVAALPPDVKAGLKAAAERLKAVGNDSADLLRAREGGQKLLVDTVAAAVGRTKQRNASAYQATAAGGRPPPRGYGPAPGAMRPGAATLNATI